MESIDMPDLNALMEIAPLLDCVVQAAAHIRNKERERCAKIATGFECECHSGFCSCFQVQIGIAAQIRSGE
jgi:hypothetical protein